MTSHSSSAPAVISSAGLLFANIPALLGFYPQESLVVLGLDRCEGATRYQLGPVIRVDLHDDQAVDTVFDLAGEPGSPLDCDVLMAIIVSEEHSDPDRDLTLRALTSAVASHTEIKASPFLGIWHIPRILTGETYTVLYSAEFFDTKSDNWTTGTVPEIVSAASMQPWHDAGTLPPPSRAEACELFSLPNPHLSAMECKEIQDRIVAQAHTIPTHPSTEEEKGLMVLVDEAAALLDAWAREGMTIDEHMDQALTSLELLTAVARTLAHIRSRDLVIHALEPYGLAAAAVLLAVARTFQGTIRANALCIYAIMMINEGLGMMAHLAVVTSAEEFRHHGLTQLLCEASVLGCCTDVARSCIEMSREMSSAVR